MPVHDWTRVDAGTFHGFHGRWIAHLTTALNTGVLPFGYYAEGDKIIPAGGWEDDDPGLIAPDVVTLQPPADQAAAAGGTALATTRPKTRFQLSLSRGRLPRRRVVVRREDGHRVVAYIEIVSAGNKDRPPRVEQFVERVVGAINAGINVLMIDLHPPGRHDPTGLHEVIADRFTDEPQHLPADEPLTLASYARCPLLKAFVERVAVGAALPDMPLFLTPERYVDVPLEPTYAEAYRGTGYPFKQVLDAP